MGKSRPRRPGRPKRPIERGRLLDLSAEAFAARGFAGASMGEIAESAGLRKASLFHHFATKEQLYVEVLSRIANDLGQLVTEAGVFSGAFLERVDCLGALAVDYLGQNRHAARLLLREMMDGGPFASGPGREMILGTLDAIVSFVEAGIAEGVIVSQDSRHLALSIVGLHLTWFSVADYSGRLVAGDPHDEDVVAARRRSVLAQVRRLCGVPPEPPLE